MLSTTSPLSTPHPNATTFVFSPHENFDFHTLSQYACVLNELSFTSMQVIYLKNISGQDHYYRSLILDQAGQLWVSTRSTTWLADQMFKQVGYSYKLWSQFLQKVGQQPRTIFPFVHGNLIYYRLPNKDEHQPDWINVSHCIKLILSQASTTNPLNFYYTCYHPLYQRIRISIIHSKPTILKQIEDSYHLSNLWFQHYNHLLSRIHHQLDLTHPQTEHTHFFHHYDFDPQHHPPITSRDLTHFTHSLFPFK
ncbi:hypothetical protein [Fundicoccus culcitae]|uniref:Uncharacterized protein n=1 Tax=Fundicoccus culcitae TaxID=2969821 RepID=A0ABY5P211_9LACT|nr:hypothetical protein [Fundicoccus culcitae]UUX32737.1 hypothetical protein NRE15_07345 [Fundicoccus culcitae]